MKNFLKADINFYPDKITYIGDRFEGHSSLEGLREDEELTIMHEWETDLMRRHAEFVCQRGGDILEIGFGMGISADFIQEQGVKSHTIIELHPQIAEKAREWAEDKPNVTIIEGDWIKILPTLLEGTVRTTHKKFDGMFFDTFGFWSEPSLFSNMCMPHCKPTSLISHWNTNDFEGSICRFVNHPNFNISFEVLEIDPPENDYFNEKTYYFPKVYVNG